MDDIQSPDFDRDRFAADLRGILKEHYGNRAARLVREFPHLHKVTISRILSRQPVSAGNVLAVCQALVLEPFDYLITATRKPRGAGRNGEQTVTTVADVLARAQKVSTGVSREAFFDDPSKRALSDETLARRDAPRAVSVPQSVPRKGADARSCFANKKTTSCFGKGVE